MPKLSTQARNIIADLYSQLVYCDIYSGSIPTSGDDAPTGTLLVSFASHVIVDGERLSWDAAVGGIAAINNIGIVLSLPAVATGTAGYAMFSDAHGTQVAYCTVGTSSAEVVLSTVDITEGGHIHLLSGTITAPG